MTTRKLIKYHQQFTDRFWDQTVIEHSEIMQGYTIRTIFKTLELALFEPLDLAAYKDYMCPTCLEELHDILGTVTIADALLVE